MRIFLIFYDIKFDGGGINTLKVVEKAIELRDKSIQKYDRVWAVFDRDSFKANSFNSAISKAEANGIKCAWSNEAFELWHLLHFHHRTTAMKRNDYKKAIEEAVNRILDSGKRPFKYKKNDPNIYTLLEEIGRQDLAINRAKQLSETIEGKNFANYNPQTQVFKLVEELIGKSNELTGEILKKYETGE